MSSVTSGEVHLTDVSESTRGRTNIDSTDRAGSSNGVLITRINMSARSDISTSSQKSSENNGSDIDNTSKNSNDGGNEGGECSSALSPSIMSETPQTAEAATIPTSAHDMPVLDTISVNEADARAAEPRGDSATPRPKWEDATHLAMDCDYEVHNTPESAYKSTNTEADRLFSGGQRRHHLRHMDIPHTTQYSSRSAAVSDSCSSSSGPSTNCGSPMALLEHALLTSHGAASASNKPTTMISATGNHTINLASRGPGDDVTIPRSEPVATSPASAISVASGASAFGQPRYVRPSTQMDAFNTSHESAVQISPHQSFSLVSLTSLDIAPVSALTTSALQGDINMDSESETDEALSPIQRAQLVAGTYSASQQLSPPSPRSRSQSQSQPQQRPSDQVSPIRSLTEALALSPRGTVNPQQLQSQRQQHQQRRNMTAIGIGFGRGQSSGSGSGDSGDGTMIAGDSHSGINSTELILQSVLARVNQVHRCCERVLQLQEHTSLRLEHLEEAVEKINQSLIPTAAESSAALAEDTTGAGSRTESAIQADQSRIGLAISDDAVARLDRSLMHQGRDRYASPSPGYMSPTGESSGHTFVHQLSTSAPAGLQSSPRSTASSVYRHPPQHLHVRSTPYSGRTSPTTPVTARNLMFGAGSLTSSTPTTGRTTGGGGLFTHSPQQLSQAHHQLHYQQQQYHHRQHRGSISRVSPPNYRVYRQDSSGQTQQGSVQQQHLQQPAVGSSWPPHRPQMQQQQQSESTGEPAGYGHAQPQPQSLQLSHPTSTLVPNPTAAFGQGFQGATGTAGSMHPQTYSAHQQRQAQDMAGYPSTGIKRQRVGDESSLSNTAAAGLPAAGAPAMVFRPSPFTTSSSQQHQQHHQHSSQLHYHLQRAHSQPHTILPPMRVGIGATGIYPGASGLGSGSGSGGTGSAHLRMPRGTLKGKAAATATTVRNRGNPEAKPTNAWLTGQRHYKIGQLRLLTLDSFYPSDTAMLQVFRQHDDFTPEQIEQYGAALLSWARGWLRYNRNAVLRHLLMSKGTVPLNQLAEVLQHDMHSTESFTTPENLRRCALLRATHYEWHASRKMGNKSMSVFRDYESALREIESLPMAEEQEARWAAVLQEEQIRRAAFIREARLNTADATAAAGSSGSTPAVARTRARQRGSSMVQAAETPMPSSSSSSSLSLASVVATAHISRQQSMDWPAYQAAETSSSAGGVARDLTHQQHQQQHFSLQQHQQHQQQQLQQLQQLQQQRYSQQQQHHHHHHSLLSGSGGTTDMHAAVGKDDDSEMSVNISPEPGNH